MREAPPLSPRKGPNLRDGTLRPIYSRESGIFDLRGFDAPPPPQAAASSGPLRFAVALCGVVMRQRRFMLLMAGLLVAYAVLAHRRQPEQQAWAEVSDVQGSKSQATFTWKSDSVETAATRLAARPEEVLQSDRSAALWNLSAIGRLPLVRGTAEALCGFVMQPDTRSIAVVGNGPLKPEQRAQIQGCDKVVRFNALNNRLPGERMDLWITRHNYRAPRPYWGFWQFNSSNGESLAESADAEEAVATAGAVLFLGGNATASKLVNDRWPRLANRSFQKVSPQRVQRLNPQVDVLDYQLLYTSLFTDSTERDLNTPDPSSGLLGLLRVLACVSNVTAVHLFGFNWSAKHYFTHQMQVEKLVVQRLGERFKLTVHQTACDGLRACEELCDGPEYQLSKEGEGEECRRKAVARKEAQAAATEAGSERRWLAELPSGDGGLMYDADEEEPLPGVWRP